jgi:crotonobetainyl-CoA:carnitine CoA-transferase CaiB-like acyl-CoA transferase
MPLSRLRVLQTGSGVALDYCGKLFADFGADVVKLEPPDGDPLRRFPPVLAGGESGVFAWLNTNKRSVTETQQAWDALLPGADLVLDGRRCGAGVSLGLGGSGTAESGPDVSFVSWPGLARPSTTFPGSAPQVVDGRHEAGHDTVRAPSRYFNAHPAGGRP